MALNRLYFITMEDAQMGVITQVEMACRAGIRMIQLRMKDPGDGAFRQTAVAAKAICDAYSALLIVNDRVEIAAAIGASGVHVGNEDMPVSAARKIMGPGKIIGGTANTAEDIRKHVQGGADYIGLGPFRFTTTKKQLSPILGKDGYRNLMDVLQHEGIDIPVFAIGGIGQADVQELLEAGVYGIAFSGMLVQAGDVRGLVKGLEDFISGNKTIRVC